MVLPSLPVVELDELEDRSPVDAGGFLRLRRQRLRLRHPDGRLSDAFTFDHIQRKALDAVVVAAHYQAEGRRWVFLRSAVRPAARLRPNDARPLPELDTLGCMWELPAGLVEPDECNVEGLQRCAARELEEELGFAIAPERFLTLGPSAFPAPGIIGERHHFFHVEVDPSTRGEPSEDGSVLEQDALIVPLPLDEIIELARGGAIEDSKSELALRRLVEVP
jgi:ADP-ribose pyrophosphatase